MSTPQRKEFCTIDATPTWRSLLPGLIRAMQRGENMAIRSQLENMAAAADKYVDVQREARDAAAQV